MQGVTELCTNCGFDPSSVGEDRLGPELQRLATGYVEVIAEASSSGCASLSSRPSEDVWSILEYVGHVMFIYETLCEMCRGVDEDELWPFDGPDPDEHVLTSGFNDVAAAAMSAQIGEAGERVRAALESLEPGALGWKFAFNGNAVPLGLLAVAFVHESHHHLQDVTELLAG